MDTCLAYAFTLMNPILWLFIAVVPIAFGLMSVYKYVVFGIVCFFLYHLLPCL